MWLFKYAEKSEVTLSESGWMDPSVPKPQRWRKWKKNREVGMFLLPTKPQRPEPCLPGSNLTKPERQKARDQHRQLSLCCREAACITGLGVWAWESPERSGLQSQALSCRFVLLTAARDGEPRLPLWGGYNHRQPADFTRSAQLEWPFGHINQNYKATCSCASNVRGLFTCFLQQPVSLRQGWVIIEPDGPHF